MAARVSVIIPCYNAERWVAESVNSCLAQTVCGLEIIVVDDGSTDRSREILAGFGQKITLESSPHGGGSAARNRGFALSTGQFIQYLDADDILLPEKIELQARFLEATKADVVYGDWRHKFHRANETVELGEVTVSGEQPDVLEALLRGWWTANHSILFRREAVQRSGGWDERLKAGQDRDFFISTARIGAAIRYQPGCHSIYRRYGLVTVSTGDQQRWLESHRLILEKAETALARSGRLTPQYRAAMAESYFHTARNYFDGDRAQYQRLMKKVLELAPGFKPKESAAYNLVQRGFGFLAAEKLASWKRRRTAARCGP